LAEQLPRQGLLVDFGGVLTTDVFDSFSAFCTAEGLAPDAARDAFRDDPLARRLLFELELGALAQDDFDAGVAEVLGVGDANGLGRRLCAGMRPDDAMLAAVADFRARGVRTGLISNSWGTALYDRDQLAALFDAIVISGDEGLRKPDPAIYELGARRLGLPPDACVFVDDLRGNLKPARALGMATVHHTSAAQTIAELEALLAAR
jgi:epoxide hydrolase-like predicted phosphatase